MASLLPSLQADDDAQRLHSLARLQTALVLHALRFPAAVRVCYSTCSVHEQENEAVVRAVLAEVRRVLVLGVM